MLKIIDALSLHPLKLLEQHRHKETLAKWGEIKGKKKYRQDQLDSIHSVLSKNTR